MALNLLWVLLFLVNGLQCLADYIPVRQYEGSTFFDGWAFYGNVDNTTWGNVTYLDRPNAVSKQLAYVNEAGNAIVQVDNTTTLVSNGAEVVNRDSIRLTSLDSYGMGSLIVMDALHIPYGCSVWPAFWTFGLSEEWPRAGEIDIIEAINTMDHNQVALHTTPGCFKGDSMPQSGDTVEENCSLNRGCLVAETKPNSYGAGFASAGGGIYALLMEPTGIRVWFFSRALIPLNLRDATATSSVDVATWGLPSAAYPASRCNLTQHFPPQNLVLLTTLCGVWAGVPSIYSSSGCPGTCFNDGVLGAGSKFNTAYWEIKYVRTYMNSASAAVTTTTTTTTPSLSTPTGASTITVVDSDDPSETPGQISTITTVIVPQVTVSPSGASSPFISRLGWILSVSFTICFLSAL